MRPLRILLVEDNEVDARGMKRYIRRAEATLVKHCRTRADFQAYWPKSTADIIILDLELGRRDTKRSGWEIATTIANSDRPIPIIIWSTYNDQDTWRRIPNQDNLVGPLSKDGSFDQFIGMLYTTVLRCNPDAEDIFAFPEGCTSAGQLCAPRHGTFRVKEYGTTDYPLIHSEYIRFAETAGSARIRIHHKELVTECSNSLEGLLDYANNPLLVQISRYHVINIKYAFKTKRTDSVYVRSMNRMQQLPIGDGYGKNMKHWWGKMRSPRKKS